MQLGKFRCSQLPNIEKKSSHLVTLDGTLT